MPFVFKRLALVLSIAAAYAADKEAPFRPGLASTYPNKMSDSGLVVAADPYTTEEKLKTAFGKLDPTDYGILPVLVLIQNDSDKAIRLDNLRARYNGSGTNRVEAIPAREVRYLKGPDRPKMVPGPTGGVKIAKTKKNPLDAWEIEGRSFTAKMLPAGQSAYGFFYFNTPAQPGATIYLTGMSEAATGKELLYFEIPLP